MVAHIESKWSEKMPHNADPVTRARPKTEPECAIAYGKPSTPEPTIVFVRFI